MDKCTEIQTERLRFVKIALFILDASCCWFFFSFLVFIYFVLAAAKPARVHYDLVGLPNFGKTTNGSCNECR